MLDTSLKDARTPGMKLFLSQRFVPLFWPNYFLMIARHTSESSWKTPRTTSFGLVAQRSLVRALLASTQLVEGVN